MTQKYDIESLIETFEEHSKQFLSTPVECFSDEKKDLHFNLAQALCEICKEIKKINENKPDEERIWQMIERGIEDYAD